MLHVTVLQMRHAGRFFCAPVHMGVLFRFAFAQSCFSVLLQCVTQPSASSLGKQMIETYFDFRLYRLWKTRQHSKLLDYDDIL